MFSVNKRLRWRNVCWILFIVNVELMNEKKKKRKWFVKIFVCLCCLEEFVLLIAKEMLLWKRVYEKCLIWSDLNDILLKESIKIRKGNRRDIWQRKDVRIDEENENFLYKELQLNDWRKNTKEFVLFWIKRLFSCWMFDHLKWKMNSEKVSSNVKNSWTKIFSKLDLKEMKEPEYLFVLFLFSIDWTCLCCWNF